MTRAHGARVGRSMRAAVAYVAKHRACAMIDVAFYLGSRGRGNDPAQTLSGGYATVWRCVRAGFVDARDVTDRGPKRYSLHVTAKGAALLEET